MTVRTRRERVSLERSLGLPMVDGRSSKHALADSGLVLTGWLGSGRLSVRVRRSWGRLPSALSVSPSAEREEREKNQAEGTRGSLREKKPKTALPLHLENHRRS